MFGDYKKAIELLTIIQSQEQNVNNKERWSAIEQCKEVLTFAWTELEAQYAEWHQEQRDQHNYATQKWED